MRVSIPKHSPIYGVSNGDQAPGAHPTVASGVVSAELAVTSNASNALGTPCELETTNRYFPV